MSKKKPTLKTEIARQEGIFTQNILDLSRRVKEVAEGAEETQAEVDNLMGKVAQLRAAKEGQEALNVSFRNTINGLEDKQNQDDAGVLALVKQVKELQKARGYGTTMEEMVNKISAEMAEKPPFALDPKVGQPKGLSETPADQFGTSDDPTKMTDTQLANSIGFLADLEKRRNSDEDFIWRCQWMPKLARMKAEQEKRKKFVGLAECKTDRNGWENPSTTAQDTIRKQSGVIREQAENLRKQQNEIEEWKKMEAIWKRVAEERLRELDNRQQDETDLREDLEMHRNKIAELQAHLREAKSRAVPYNPFRPGCE
jgi:hypothetical protein